MDTLKHGWFYFSQQERQVAKLATQRVCTEQVLMIAILRWLQKLAKKENLLRKNYNRSHPHFLLYLGADALISVALVAGGFHYFGPQIWEGHERFMIEHPGIVPAPVDRFLDYMTSEEAGIFWIGPREGCRYTIETVSHRFHRVSYFSTFAVSLAADEPQVTITTYPDRQTFVNDVRSLLGAQTEKRMLSGGNAIEFAGK